MLPSVTNTSQGTGSKLSQVRSRRPELDGESLPADVRNAIPAIWRLEEVVVVPHLHYRRMPMDNDAIDQAALTFFPARMLGAARFSAVPVYA